MSENRSAQNIDGNSQDNVLLFQSDSSYQELLIHYQSGEWEKCNQTITQLLIKYPSEPELQQFKNDIDLQLILRFNKDSGRKASGWKFPRRNLVIMLVVFLFLLVGILMAGVVMEASQRRAEVARAGDLLAQQQALNALETQAQALLLAGNQNSAQQIIDQIQASDPEYPGLQDLLTQAKEVSRLEQIYTEAMSLVAAGNDQDALLKFQEIETATPQYRDVQHQIKAIDKRKLVAELIASADTAYEQERWLDVIAAYEKAFQTYSDLDSPAIEEKLFNSYVNSILEMLNTEDVPIEDIEKAEGFYRKAMGLMVPQSKEFAEERKNLQEIVVDLLAFKFHQTAKNLLENENYSENSVSNAVSYLKKANRLNPEDSKVSVDLGQAEIYLDGLQNFDRLNWTPAIESFKKVTTFDNNYANGMALQMLYEALFSRGSRYLSIGYYADARSDFEAAEIIAWGRTNNNLQLFQVQIALGKTIGKMKDFKNSTSYFNYAYKTINATARVVSEENTDLLTELNLADSSYLSGNYSESFDRYMKVTDRMNAFYTTQKVEILTGDNLAHVAKVHNSTVTAIMEQNPQVKTIVIKANQTLVVPIIP